MGIGSSNRAVSLVVFVFFLLGYRQLKIQCNECISLLMVVFHGRVQWAHTTQFAVTQLNVLD